MITSIMVIWWHSRVSSSQLLSQLETVSAKRRNYQKHHWKYNLGWGWWRRGLFPRSSLNVNGNGTLKAKVKTVIRIQPTAPLIYSPKCCSFMDLLHIQAAARFLSRNVTSNSSTSKRRHSALCLCMAGWAVTYSQPDRNLGVNLEPPPTSA